MDIGIGTIVVGFVIFVVVFWIMYELVLGKQWWFYHARKILRDIQDKLER